MSTKFEDEKEVEEEAPNPRFDLSRRITETTYLRDADGGITVLSGGLAEVPAGREADVLDPDVAQKELAAAQAADDEASAEQNAGAAKLRNQRIEAIEGAANFEEAKPSILALIGRKSGQAKG